MYTYRFGGKDTAAYELEVADDMVAVRTKERQDLTAAVRSNEGRAMLKHCPSVLNFPEAGVFVLRCRDRADKLLETRDRARGVLTQEEDVRFAGRVLRDPKSGDPVLYTENLFVKFREGTSAEACEAFLEEKGLAVKKRPAYQDNLYFVQTPEGTGLDVFRIAEELLQNPEVEHCYPELVRERAKRAVAPQQWHLKVAVINGRGIDQHVNVEEAWTHTKGAGTIVAIIDDGVDVDHEEFNIPGKVTAPRDVTEDLDDPRPKDYHPIYPDNHGTACAGVACAAGEQGASGVAPEARLMPVRLASGLGSQDEAEAFRWAADQGADVISCSWGPPDGHWWDLNDPRHRTLVPLSPHAQAAIDYAVTKGRNGKGCVVCFAAGNGNENVEMDGYASYDKVVAVSACNDSGKRSVYSDYGESVWCAFPSGDSGHPPFGHPDPNTPGIWTTDRKGRAGYNPGNLIPGAPPPGDTHGNYTESFSGTSSACPGAAGIAALIIATNPDLTAEQVKDVIRRSCVRIDEEGGNYDERGHSPYYGYGRPDAGVAVKLAKGL